ncbi:hypothetical protein [Vibrio crassostreae]|uniref:hypothetical protein n=1 Tax=Vibrio crassostreae TaxID=246167 RepID=UPI001B30E106|nr:hypothetical protein [Vibrio crassostreae]
MLNKDGVCIHCYREFDFEVEKEMFGDRGLKEGSACPSDDCPSYDDKEFTEE